MLLIKSPDFLLYGLATTCHLPGRNNNNVFALFMHRNAGRVKHRIQEPLLFVYALRHGHVRRARILQSGHVMGGTQTVHSSP